MGVGGGGGGGLSSLSGVPNPMPMGVLYQTYQAINLPHSELLSPA